MPLVPPSGFSTSTKTPGFVFGVAFGGSGKTAGAAPMRLCLMGNMLAAGTATLDTPVEVGSTDDVKTLTGAGSELARMAKRVFDQYRLPSLWICPVTESAGVQATAKIVVANAATASGSLRLWVGDEFVDVAITSGDATTAIATAITAAVNAETDWPATAGVVSSTVTLTWRQKGTRGNNANVRFAFSANLTTTLALNGYTASAVKGTGTFGDNNAGGGGVTGTLTDDVTNALANMASMKFDHIAAAMDDTANWTKITTHVNTYSAIAERKRQRAIVATIKTLANAKTDAATQNAVLLQIGWHYKGDASTGEIAAQVAAARLYGDGQVGGGIGTSRGEQAYRAANLDGTLLASITEQVDVADQPLGSEIESALNAGLTPLAPSPAHPGFTRIVRSITSRWKDAAGNPNYAVLDTTKPEVIHYAADRFESGAVAEFPNKNLAPDNANGRPPRHPDVVTPSQFRAWVISELYAMEVEGLATNVADHEDEVLVAPASDNPALLLGYIPFDVIEGLHGFAGLLDQIG
jgi:phage tail sheath gpL-like